MWIKAQEGTRCFHIEYRALSFTKQWDVQYMNTKKQYDGFKKNIKKYGLLLHYNIIEVYFWVLVMFLSDRNHVAVQHV